MSILLPTGLAVSLTASQQAVVEPLQRTSSKNTHQRACELVAQQRKEQIAILLFVYIIHKNLASSAHLVRPDSCARQGCFLSRFGNWHKVSPEKTLYTNTIIKFNSYVMMMEVYGSPHNEDLLGSRMNSFYLRRVHAYIFL